MCTFSAFSYKRLLYPPIGDALGSGHILDQKAAEGIVSCILSPAAYAAWAYWALSFDLQFLLTPFSPSDLSAPPHALQCVRHANEGKEANFAGSLRLTPHCGAHRRRWSVLLGLRQERPVGARILWWWEKAKSHSALPCQFRTNRCAGEVWFQMNSL